jgi:hypothetical protein
MFVKGKVKFFPQQAEVDRGIPGWLTLWIFLTFGTTRVVVCQACAPAAFTPGEIHGTHFQGLSRSQDTWFQLCLYSTHNPHFTFHIMFHDTGVYWFIKYCFYKLNTTANQVIIWALLHAHCWRTNFYRSGTEINPVQILFHLPHDGNARGLYFRLCDIQLKNYSSWVG